MQAQIPDPCTEDWNAMTPAGAGRHCMQCAKTVVDFTDMSAEDISIYLQMNAGELLCGRFRKDQIDTELPSPDEYVLQVLKAPLPFLKQIAAIVLFAILTGVSGYSANATARHKTKHSTTNTGGQHPQKPSVLLGKVMPPVTDTTKSGRIMGDVMMHPEPRDISPIQGGIRVYNPKEHPTKNNTPRGR